MINLNNQKIRDLLQSFDFKKLFIEELNWSQPNNNKELVFNIENTKFNCKMVSQLSGVTVFEVISNEVPTKKTIKQEIYKEISKYYHENLIIFINENRTQSVWYWVKREGNKKYSREHYYFTGQPGDLFLSKLSSMVIDISEFDEYGNLPITEVASKLKNALDIEKVTKKFYKEFKEQHDSFLEFIEGIEDSKEKSWYASILLNRLMFIYFLQRKGFINNGELDYLSKKLNESKNKQKDIFYSNFLKKLFFEGFAIPEEKRNPETNKLLGKIKYLNGGLFLEHHIEKNCQIAIKDEAFDNIFNLFESYSWNLNDTAGGKDNEINPDVLGYIFEKYINQKELGAYYTKPEITEYLCEKTINKLLVEKINSFASNKFDSISDVLLKLDEDNCRILFRKILPEISILDPACGSGAFLVSAMKTLINIYSAILGKIEFLSDRDLKRELEEIKKDHSSIAYFIKKQIITNNLFGVDIVEEATEIAKLRLFLALVASAEKIDDLEPLPNIDFNIMSGNSLIGLLHVSSERYDEKKKKEQLGLFVSNKTYQEIVADKNRLVETYRKTSTYSDDLSSLKEEIKQKKLDAYKDLNQILLDDFNNLGIKYEEATWDEDKGKLGKTKKRALTIEDINKINPFHWGYEFDQIINERGGFDIIIANPPWDVFKPNSKEFLQPYSNLITKKKMDKKGFDNELKKLLVNEKIKKEWLGYNSNFPHISLYFRNTKQYENQISVVNGKKQGTDINLFKLFTEQSFNLLKKTGHCGIVIPSGIYTDIGAKQLRELLFDSTEITGLFCFENRKEVFENVHRSFKFVVLTFEKGYKTKEFPASFMKQNVSDLQDFPKNSLNISIELIKKTSPDSFSITEFKNDLDIKIANKFLKFPLLGEKLKNNWNILLSSEFHMTNDSNLFYQRYEKSMLPLYEGKMMNQFTHTFSKPKYWIREDEGRKALLGKEKDINQKLEYQSYRLCYRSIASSTNERTIISTILPPNVFTGNSLNLNRNKLDNKVLLYLAGMFNSFVLDFYIRRMVSANVNMFYMYQLPVPRLNEKDKVFKMIVERAGRLICTTPEFNDLAKEIGLKVEPINSDYERIKLRAELDAIIAHLYELTEEEFIYILSTFNIVPEPIKVNTQNAYRDYNNGLIK
ncbi:MAG: DNA methyltransferase [Candidatus Sericytochromatia bacterium]